MTLATTPGGIVYPTTGDQVTPLNSHFQALAESADDADAAAQARPWRSFGKTTTGAIGPNATVGVGGWVGSNGDPGDSIGITLGGDGLLTVSESGVYQVYLKLGFTTHTGGMVRCIILPAVGGRAMGGNQDEAAAATVSATWLGQINSGDTIQLCAFHNISPSLGFDGTDGLNTAWIIQQFPTA